MKRQTIDSVTIDGEMTTDGDLHLTLAQPSVDGDDPPLRLVIKRQAMVELLNFISLANLATNPSWRR